MIHPRLARLVPERLGGRVVEKLIVVWAFGHYAPGLVDFGHYNALSGLSTLVQPMIEETQKEILFSLGLSCETGRTHFESRGRSARPIVPVSTHFSSLQTQ